MSSPEPDWINLGSERPRDAIHLTLRADELARRTGTVTLADDGFVVHVELEHLLLTILEDQDGAPLRALTALGADVEQIRSGVAATLPASTIDEVHEQHRRSAPGVAQAHIYRHHSPSLRFAIDRAQDEAEAFGAAEVRSEHLLLGILAVDESPAARAIEAQGVSADALRVQLGA